MMGFVGGGINTMDKEITKYIDPFKQSLENLMVVVFQKSSAQAYPVAVNVAKGASYYNEIFIDKKLLHIVTFAKTKADAGRAQAIINYITGWKGVQIFAGGKVVQNTWEIKRLLECYLIANSCTDWKAHCFKIIDDPLTKIPEDRSMSFTIRVQQEKPSFLKTAVEINRYIFPCSFLHGLFRFQVDHPSSPVDQIQAGAVKSGCDWCPFFDAKNFKLIGTRSILKD
jgi:hypothetical protein